jgi:hypothetical protein
MRVLVAACLEQATLLAANKGQYVSVKAIGFCLRQSM